MLKILFKKTFLGRMVMALLSLLILSSLTSPSVNAISDYDNVLKLTSSLHLSRDGTTQGAYPCPALDMTTKWAGLLNDDSAWWTNTQYIGGATRESTQEDFASALNNRTGWAVSQLKYTNASTTGTGNMAIGDAVRIIFSPSSTAYVDFTTFYGEKYASNA